MNLKQEKLIDKGDHYFYYMSQNEIKDLKEYIWMENKKHCPILKKEIPLDKMVLDHKHKLKSQEPNKIDGACRNSLEFRANAAAGKIENIFRRYGFHNEDLSLPDMLRNIADYLENSSYKIDSSKIDNFAKLEQKEIYFIHPNEVPKRKKVSKRDLNLLKKWWPILKPRSKKEPKFIYETEEFQRLFDQAKELNKTYGTIKKYIKVKNENKNK